MLDVIVLIPDHWPIILFNGFTSYQHLPFLLNICVIYCIFVVDAAFSIA